MADILFWELIFKREKTSDTGGFDSNNISSKYIQCNDGLKSKNCALRYPANR